VSESLRALTVVAGAHAEERARAHAEACRIEQRAKAALDDATDRCAVIDRATRDAKADRGVTAAERAAAQTRIAVWRARRAAAEAVRAAAEKEHAASLEGVERARAALGTAHGDRRVAETALARADDAARAVRARRAEDEQG
jgi:hypothetical protein